MKWLMLLLCAVSVSSLGTEFSGKVQAVWHQSDLPTTWLESGTGVTRFDDNDVALQQTVMRIKHTVVPSFDVQVDASYYADGDQHLGLTQLQLIYKPLLPSRIKWRARVGFFYPEMSLENVDTNWLSPYTYSQSAINSWIGEELRTAGAEFILYRPGRAVRSPWSWEFRAAVFKGNDPLGSIISWRGFALHDRQSLHHERLQFAPYPTVIDTNVIWHPDWVEPFTEIDGKWGVYVGLHLDYLRQTQLRYYYYDNLADPNAVNDQRLYAWHTKFHSLAMQHNITTKTRFIMQWMTGDTLMGEHFVYTQYDAFYAMLSHRQDRHRFSARVDIFDVDEDDIFENDQNNSHGHGITVNWRYDVSDHWQVGVEYSRVHSDAANRVQFNLPTAVTQQQTLLVSEYHW
ncbi:hypothetical protein [Alteromonas sp. C1M14]|uniref:hypothetical protein n=1 Tax=Alteromonas sp. C1M14 TaxID=2841567 RepID=UPI001C09A6B5|nr:hypothetical protein [Alteromonas sp. C1M14]MBU2977283.1 hypothetical protein [Alteromonas sp. C1M14]